MRPFDLHTFLVGKLRAATRQCPAFSAAKAAARVPVRVDNIENSDGKWIRATVTFTSNGHSAGEVVLTKAHKSFASRDRVMFNCASCKRLFFDHEYLPTASKGARSAPLRLKKKAMVAIDHIDPCVDPAVGFQDWDTYIRRLFEGKLQILCNYSGERDGFRSCHHLKTKSERADACSRRAAEKLKKVKVAVGV